MLAVFPLQCAVIRLDSDHSIIQAIDEITCANLWYP